MDFPVEATVHLNNFPSGRRARDILRSHGLEVTDLSSNRVLVKGMFFELKAAKASLEPLLYSRPKTPPSFSPVPHVSAGAIPKTYASDDGNRSLRRNKSSHASPSSPAASPSWAPGSSNNRPTSPEYGASFSSRPDQGGSFRSGRETLVVDADVFEYAKRLRKKEIDDILSSHNVVMVGQAVGDSCSITLQGRSAKIAAGKLQSLLNNLSKSLRTQEVPLSDVDREGKALLERIQRGRNIDGSVVVCWQNGRVHLIGPSVESYELKQRLLGRPVERLGRTGRTFDKNSRARSSSLPPTGRKNAQGDSGAFANPSPVGAAGYSPSKNQDDKSEPKREIAAPVFRRRSHSESRGKAQAQRVNGHVQDMENKPSSKSPKKALLPLLMFNDIKKRFKGRKR